MAKKILIIISLMISIRATVLGQSEFQSIIPGSNTRNDAERLLGKPVRAINATDFEYKAAEGVARLEVAYRHGAAIVERIEVYFARPISREALAQKFDLPQKADGTRKNAEGKLVEFFGGSSLLALGYASGDADSGVNQMGYYSSQLFARASGVDVLAPARELQLEAETSLDGTRLTYYPSDNVEQCKADCANNSNCKGFTFINAGTYNPGDSAMCYLLSAVTRKKQTPGHISGVKKLPTSSH